MGRLILNGTNSGKENTCFCLRNRENEHANKYNSQERCSYSRYEHTERGAEPGGNGGRAQPRSTRRRLPPAAQRLAGTSEKEITSRWKGQGWLSWRPSLLPKWAKLSSALLITPLPFPAWQGRGTAFCTTSPSQELFCLCPFWPTPLCPSPQTSLAIAQPSKGFSVPCLASRGPASAASPAQRHPLLSPLLICLAGVKY